MKSRRPSTRRQIFEDEGSAPDLGVDPSSIGEADPATAARNVVLRRLTRAPQSRAQLAEALAAKGIPDEVASQVLDRMVEVGLVNDAEYAELYVRSRRASRGLAPRVLAQELRAKGISAELIDHELSTIDVEDDRALARSLVHKRLPATAGLDPQARTRRLAKMLIRKGFNSSLAFEVVRSSLQGDEMLE